MLSENIRKFRKLRHLSQVELAESLHVSKQCVSNWENNNIMPSVDMLIKLAGYFSVSADFLLGLDNRRWLDVTGLSEAQISHIKQIIDDILKN